MLFVDEVHRFNKAQQDALLPGVENRWVTFIGATTENPFFSVISPLLSRSLLLTLEPLSEDDIRGGAGRSPTRAASTGRSRSTPRPRDQLVRLAGGDAGAPLTYLEAAAGSAGHRRRDDHRRRSVERRWTGRPSATTARATSTTT